MAPMQRWDFLFLGQYAAINKDIFGNHALRVKFLDPEAFGIYIQIEFFCSSDRFR